MNYIIQIYCLFIKFMKYEKKCMFIYAYVLSGIIRLSILLLPFKYIKTRLGEPKMESSNELSDDEIEMARQIRQLVLKVCNHTPWQSKCLVRAILTQHLLSKRNISSTLYLGVSKNENGKMQAHAWLRCGPVVIMGGENKNDFIEVAKFCINKGE